MHRSSLIGHIVELHHLVLTQGHPADAVVRDFLRQRHYLGSHDRRFIQETLYGMFRNAILIREIIAGIPENRLSPLSSLPSYIAYALQILREHSETVISAVRGLWSTFYSGISLEGFVTGVAQSDPLIKHQDPVQQLAIRESFPLAVVREWTSRYSLDEAQTLCAALNSSAPTTTRVNTLRCTRDACASALEQEGVQVATNQYSPVALTLGKRVNIKALNAFRDGYFEMQDEGSQLVSFLTVAGPGMTVIDACAGGGGKTLHLANLMNNEGKLIAFHQDEHQQKATQERAQRAGARIESRILTKDSGPDDLHDSADVVLVDAPCSGTGVFRRNPFGKLTYTTEVSERFSRLQSEILSRNASLVRKGGRLIYATCTLLQKENESVVETFLDSHKEFSITSASDTLQRLNIPSSQSPFMTLLPHKTNTDGFFAAVLSRTSD